MKICPACKARKPSSAYQKNRAAPDGLQFHCRACRSRIDARPEKRATDRARYHADAGQHWRDVFLQRKYGVTPATYKAMLRKQHRRCAICEGTAGKRRWHVDHTHSTGKVRGLLCGKCNIMLGMARDNPSVLIKGAAYLQRAGT